jgi:hypothetical protein
MYVCMICVCVYACMRNDDDDDDGDDDGPQVPRVSGWFSVCIYV